MPVDMEPAWKVKRASNKVNNSQMYLYIGKGLSIKYFVRNIDNIAIGKDIKFCYA